MVICQKWLTGHPKGAAAAWMLNGLLQSMTTGVIPGNRNVDNVSAELQRFDHLVYPNEAIKVPEIPAALLKSFGFGQAGAEVLLIHPDRLLATLSETRYQAYKDKVAVRNRKSLRVLHRILAGKQPLVNVKNHPPYSEEQQMAVYLDPQARARYDPSSSSWSFGVSAEKAARATKDQRGEAQLLQPQQVMAKVEAADRVRFDRREAEALLAAMRRGRQFGKLRDPVELLEERHLAAADRRPGEFPADDDVFTSTGGETKDALESEGIFRRSQRSPVPRRGGLLVSAWR